LITIEEPLSHYGCGGLYERQHEALSALCKVNTGERLIDLKRPRFTGFRIQVAPVVEAESHIAVLLNLKDNSSTSQGVNGSGRDEYGVAWLREDVHQVIHDCPGD
jgi:hypothetical protein